MRRSILVLWAAYLVLTGALMRASSHFLQLRGIEVLTTGWIGMWAAHALFYSPGITSATAAAWFSKLPVRVAAPFLGSCLILILFVMEVALVLDFEWPAMLLAWIVFPVVFFAAGATLGERYGRRRRRPTWPG
jgi:hypothetical protein